MDQDNDKNFVWKLLHLVTQSLIYYGEFHEDKPADRPSRARSLQRCALGKRSIFICKLHDVSKTNTDKMADKKLFT